MGIERDHYWMQQALKQAALAAACGEVPVGAVLVKDDTLIAQAHNKPIQNSDPSAHAEMEVLRLGGQALNNYRLNGTTLYVTLEPCLMCAGLLVHARIQRLVYGATDPKAGAVSSIAQVLSHPKLNHHVDVTAGVLAQDCGQLLTQFFQRLRGKVPVESP